MDFKKYQEEMHRTANIDAMHFFENLTVGALGISGEAGEVTDCIKKVVFHHHELNREELAYELGDVLWYVTYLSQCLGYSLEEIAQLNIEKLQKRYPEGWSAERSINRE